METQEVLVKLSDYIIFAGPSVIQIRQRLTWTTDDKMAELPLEFTFASQLSQDEYLVMTRVDIVKRVIESSDESPDYEITGKCEQNVLQILSPNFEGECTEPIIKLEYNPKTKQGALISMVTQPK